jgi:hypothetical protein
MAGKLPAILGMLSKMYCEEHEPDGIIGVALARAKHCGFERVETSRTRIGNGGIMPPSGELLHELDSPDAVEELPDEAVETGGVLDSRQRPYSCIIGSKRRY